MGLFDRFRKKEEDTAEEEMTAVAEETKEAAPEQAGETAAPEEAAAEEEAVPEEEAAPAPQKAQIPQGPRMTPLTPEQIAKSEENGKVLTYLIERHHEMKNKDSFLTAVRGLESVKLWVPMHILVSKSDLEAMKAASGKAPVKPRDPVRFVPDILKNKEGDRLYPAFTTRDEIPADYRKRFQWVQVDAAECGAQVIRNERLSALIINPFTKNLLLRREILEKMIVRKTVNAENEENAAAVLPEEPHFTS